MTRHASNHRFIAQLAIVLAFVVALPACGSFNEGEILAARQEREASGLVAGQPSVSGSGDAMASGEPSVSGATADIPGEPSDAGSPSAAAEPSAPGAPSTPGSPSAEARNANPAEGFTENEIKIGLMCALSGPFASVTKLGCYVSQAVFADASKSGINGRKLKVIVRDDQFNGPKGQTVIRQFIDDDKVFLIDGGASPFGMVLTANYIDQNKVPAFSPGVFLEEYGHPYVFVNLPPTVITGARIAAVYLVKELGHKRIALMTHTGPEWGRAADEFTFAVEQLGGQVVTVQRAAQDEALYSGFVSNVRAANPDALYMNLMPDGVIKYYLGAKQVNYKPKFTLNPPTGEAELVPDGVGDFAYPYVTTTCLDPPVPGTARWDRFQSIAKQYYPNEDWDTISTGTRQLYAISLVIRDSLTAMGGEISRAEYMSLMHSRAWESDGINPPLKWEPTHTVPPFTKALVTEFEKSTRIWRKRTEFIDDPWPTRY